MTQIARDHRCRAQEADGPGVAGTKGCHDTSEKYMKNVIARHYGQEVAAYVAC